MNKHFIKLIIFIYFHRFIGITFNGLSIDSNGNLTQNRFYKIYGYFALIIWNLFEFKLIYSFITRYILAVHKSNASPLFLFILLQGSLKVILRIIFHIFLNICGFDLFISLVRDLKPYIKKKFEIKLLLVFMIWITFSIIILLLILDIIFQNSLPFYIIILFLHDYCLHSHSVIVWSINIYIYNILDDIHCNLNSCYLNRNNRRMNNIFLTNKIIFLKVRKTLNYLNKRIDFVIILWIISIIYLIMFDIFDIFSIKSPTLYLKSNIIKINMKTLLHTIFDLFLYCLICGSVNRKREQLIDILDKYNSRDLTVNEYKEWLMFKTILKNRDIGLKIGNFASFNKSTLICV